MSGGATFEERIGEVLAELYDGASLMTGDAAGAADLVVSVSAEAARTYERFERPPDFRTWIVTRLVRHYMDQVASETGRAAPVRGARPDDDIVPRAGAVAVLEALVTRLSALERSAPVRFDQVLRTSIEQLSLERRTAVWLVDRTGFDYADAARALGISVADLRSLLFRARRELQLRLGLALRASGSSTGDLKQRGEA